MSVKGLSGQRLAKPRNSIKSNAPFVSQRDGVNDIDIGRQEKSSR